MRKIILLLLVSIFSAFFSIVIYRQFFECPHPTTKRTDATGESRYTHLIDRLLDDRSNFRFRSAAPTHFTKAAMMATPSVVYIHALQQTNGGLWPMHGNLSGSSGSGVIISPDGYIVTNQHVVENATDVKVMLNDRREFKANIIGADASTDIALLKINADELPFLIFGNSDSVCVGEWVLAVGNPFRLASTVTAGIVSAKGRNINILGGGTSIESFIQTDAAVNPGNSGGALVNTAGELVGINTAIITESGSYEGYSFAVPSNLVQKVVRDLRDFGEVQRAFLGIGIQDLDSELAEEMGLPQVQGVFINRVHVNSSAADAGLLERDVIVGLNGVTITSTPELQEMVGRMRPGDVVDLLYYRDGKKMRTQLTLKDGNNLLPFSRVRGDELLPSVGIEIRELTREEKRRFPVAGGVVTAVVRGSVAYQVNMQPGYIITSVNGNTVRSAGETVSYIRDALNWVVLDGFYPNEPDKYSYRFKKQ